MREQTLHLFDAVYPGNPGSEFLLPEVADASKTYPPLQPEAEGELSEAYRTGRIVHIQQDLNSMAFNNTYPYVTYAPDAYGIPQRQSNYDVWLNIVNSPDIPGK